ncbi:hypothetical protein Tco_0357074 [Tanacetum coccineum]
MTTSFASKLSSSLSNLDPLVAHNSLQLMRCPGTYSTLAFFPTGSNADQVGLIMLFVRNSQSKVSGDSGITNALTLINALIHQIVNISVTNFMIVNVLQLVSMLMYLAADVDESCADADVS